MRLYPFSRESAVRSRVPRNSRNSIAYVAERFLGAGAVVILRFSSARFPGGGRGGSMGKARNE